MAISVRYVAKETAINLLRNRMMALAAVLTVAVSLSLVGTALLLRQAAASQVGVWANNVSLQIFENPTLSQAGHASIESMIAQTPQIHSCKYLDHDQSYQLMKQVLAQDPQAVAAVTPAETPPVYECTLTNPNAAATVAASFKGRPGVYNVNYPGQSIRVTEEVTGVIQKILLGIALVLIISSLVLILNAIRMAIFARRREVGVMKLVGATNWFIRIPFMLEGLVQGLCGSAVAAGIVFVANVLFRDLVRQHVHSLANAVVSSHDLVVTEILLLVVGTLVGATGSAIAVRRFLDV
jgi:cell division transport system permease protein